MASEQDPPLQPNRADNNSDHASPLPDQNTPGQKTDEIAMNDGSVTEALDTAFHGKPGWSEGENLSGSNRADYYESRSQGKTDVEEELDALKKQQKQ